MASSQRPMIHWHGCFPSRYQRHQLSRVYQTCRRSRYGLSDLCMDRTPRRQAARPRLGRGPTTSRLGLLRRELPRLAGADIRFVQGDVRPIHAHMRAAAQGKNLWLVGGGGLVGQFYDAGLLDELIIQIGSVTLGAGKPLLPRQITSPSLRLVLSSNTARVSRSCGMRCQGVPRPCLACGSLAWSQTTNEPEASPAPQPPIPAHPLNALIGFRGLMLQHGPRSVTHV